MASKVSWCLEADFLQACNCDYGCPCEFSAPPTRGFCEGMGAWRINRGNYGELSLDGLGFAFAARWPGPLHEGNGVCALLFDQQADYMQRDALLQISSGKAGGPFEILSSTFSRMLDPHYAPFGFEFNGRTCSVHVKDAVQVALAPIKNPVTGQPESLRLDHGTGFMFKEAEILAATELTVRSGELQFNWPNKAGFLSRVNYSNG